MSVIRTVLTTLAALIGNGLTFDPPTSSPQVSRTGCGIGDAESPVRWTVEVAVRATNARC